MVYSKIQIESQGEVSHACMHALGFEIVLTCFTIIIPYMFNYIFSSSRLSWRFSDFVSAWLSSYSLL